MTSCGQLPLIVGTPGPRGTGEPVRGGYVVTGRWGFGSGIAQCDWVIGGFTVPENDGGARVCVVPKERVEVVDNWRVAGLQGTGSFDFRMDEVFVPTEMTFEKAAGACRGGALLRQEAHVFLSNEVPPLCVGMARRALDDMTEMASKTERFPDGKGLSERAVFHSALSLASPVQRHLRDCLAARQHIGVCRGELRAGRPPADPVGRQGRALTMPPSARTRCAAPCRRGRAGPGDARQSPACGPARAGRRSGSWPGRG
jgi:hypothetical protein